jgi:hypothetical protein
MIINAVKQELADMAVPLTAGGIYLCKRSGERLFAVVAEGGPLDAAQLPAATVRIVSDAAGPDSAAGAEERLGVEIHLAVGALSPASDRSALIFLRNLVYEAFDRKRQMGGIADHYITEVRRDNVFPAESGALRSVVRLELSLYKPE